MTKTMAFLLAAATLLGIAASPAPSEPRVGGPCSYDKYPGKAKITKIVKTDASRQQAKEGWGYEGVEIWFTFTPDKPLPAGRWWSDRVGGPQLFQLLSCYPGEKYVEKYGIKEGKEFPATLSIIKEGACSPIGYDLKGLDPTDYFESRSKK